MSSPGRRRSDWLSVPPPIPPPGAGDISSQIRSRALPPRQVEGGAKQGAKSPSKREPGVTARPPPVWHPTIDASGRPIVRGKSPARRYSLDSTEREPRSPSGRNQSPEKAAILRRTGEERRGKSPTRRLPRIDAAEDIEADVVKGPSGQDSNVGDAAEAPVGKTGKPKMVQIAEEPAQQPVASSSDTYAIANIQARRRSLAKHNEASHHSSQMEEVSDLTPWESFTDACDRTWRAFHDLNNRRSLKHVVASLHVLRTYHDAFLSGTIPVSMQFKSWLRAGILGTVWHLAEFFFAVLSGCLYIYSTYVPAARGNWCFHLQNSISIGFLCDYILRVYTEPVRFYYVCSSRGLTDLLSVIPVILFFRTAIYGGDIIRLLQFVRILRIFDVINKLGFVGISVTSQIVMLAFATFGLIIFDAGILQWLEYFTASREKREKCPVEGCLSFWQAIYFLVVTVSTVGYGDISPKTTWGQAVTCLTILIALVCLPVRIKKIHSLAAKRPYGGSFSTRKIVGSRFLILTGSVTFPGVQSFLAEFFKPTHRQELDIYPLRVIILGPFVPSFDFRQLLSCYHGSAEFIEGSPIRQSDLARVSAHKAMSIFLLANRDAEDWKIEDSAQIVRALAIHRFCCANCERGHSRIIVEVLDPETQRSAVWDEVHTGYVEVICPARIHYKMMARSCFVKGLYTLVTNLFTSELRLKYTQRKHFLTEYFQSFDNEVYPVILPVAFQNLPFEEVAEIIFVNFSSILFAVDTEVVTKSTQQRARKVLLYPKGYLIRHDDVGMVITNDLSTAFAIALYKQSDEKVGQFRKLWDQFTTAIDIRRTNTEGIQLLDPVTHRWRRTSLGFGQRKPSVMPTESESFGVQGPQVFPTNPDSQYRLESELRSAIQRVYTAKDYPNWRNRAASVTQYEIGDTEVGVKVSKDSRREHVYRFPKGMSLEQAAEELLAWPPVSKDEPPHPAVLERREELILINLQERKISMVAFSKPHILLCCQAGWPANLFYFLAEHRKPNFPNPPIVILYPHDPTAHQWGSVGIFENVFFIKGSPIYELDLMRAGVLQAVKVVILADQGVPVDLGEVGLQDDLRYRKRPPAAYTSDIENIVVAANVQRLYGRSVRGLVIVEMQHAEAFHYLLPQYKISRHHFIKKDLRRNKDALVHFGPPYMEGRAVSSTMLGFLMRSTFYNRNTLSIVEQFVQGGYIATEEGLSSDRPRVLDQIPVPTGYANKVYSFLFLSLLLDNNVLALGLYRAKGTLGAPTSYVLTNPSKDCIVNPDDLVYIIA